MIVLLIIGCIFLLLFLLLLFPVSVEGLIRSGEPGETSIRVNYLFLFVRLLPRPEKAKKEKKQKKPVKVASDAEGEAEPQKKKQKLSFQDILTLVRSSKKALRLLCRHLIFSKVRIYLSVGAEDAHKTALRYSQIKLAVDAFLDVISSLFVLREPDVIVLPEFTRGSTAYEIYFSVAIRPIFVVIAGGGVLFRFLRLSLARGKNPAGGTPPRNKKPARQSAAAK